MEAGTHANYVIMLNYSLASVECISSFCFSQQLLFFLLIRHILLLVVVRNDSSSVQVGLGQIPFDSLVTA